MAAQSHLHRITTDPLINHGKPSIRNLRYAVQYILEYLAAGDSIEDIITEFKDLTREDILACLEWAAAAASLKDIEVPAA